MKKNFLWSIVFFLSASSAVFTIHAKDAVAEDPAMRLEQAWNTFSKGMQEAQRSLVDPQYFPPPPTAPIVYAQPDNHFSFPLHCLGKPVVRSCQRLAELLAVFPFDVMQGSDMQHCFSEAVEQLILARLARGEPIPTATQFAHTFNISDATFRRRLAEENARLSDIKERCRRQLATELLTSPSRIKIADVALRLGFSDARAFRRAFRQWTGASPEAYRLGQVRYPQRIP